MAKALDPPYARQPPARLTVPVPTMQREMRREKREAAAADRLEEYVRVLKEDKQRVEEEKPRTRAECLDGPRPCPFVSCRHHLYLDEMQKGSIKFNFPTLEPWEIPETCSLDIADRGGVTLQEAADVMGLTRERLRQLELELTAKMRGLMDPPPDETGDE